MDIVTSTGRVLHTVDGDLAGADLRGADLYCAVTLDTSFRNADLSGAKFNGVSFEGVDFTGANLDNADFGRDNLGGSTSLQGGNLAVAASLRHAIFTGAEYDHDTVFPKGFDPGKHGLILREEKSREKRRRRTV